MAIALDSRETSLRLEEDPPDELHEEHCSNNGLGCDPSVRLFDGRADAIIGLIRIASC